MDDARKIVAPSPRRVKGRGAASYADGRYALTRTEAADDGWDSLAGALAEQSGAMSHPDTRVSEERARSVISRNDSPDIGFSQSVNPYRGCEHGWTLY